MSTSKARVSFIFFTILLDAIGLGLVIPVLPDVLRRFTSNPTAVSEYFGYFIGVYALMQFVASPILGSLSDKWGRRPVLLISLLGAGLDYLFMAFAPSLSLLFLGRMISGITGASMTVASSYMADISHDSNRASNFGMIGAAWGIGFIVGPLLGGTISTMTASATAPFIVAAILTILNFIFGYFILPESLPKQLRRQVSLSALNPFISIIAILKPSPFVSLIWIYFFVFLAGQVHPVNWTLYTQTKFQWTAWHVGLSLSFVGVMIAIVQGGLTGRIVPKLGEHKSLTLGLAVYGVTFTLFGIATQGWMMYAIVVVFSLAGITIPALQSIVAKHIPPERQGELQGSLVSLGSLSSILAPLLFTQLFVYFTKPETPIHFPGAAYVGAGMICAGTLALNLLTRDRKP